MKCFLILLFGFLALVLQLSASEITAKVVSVVDGNTIDIESANGVQRVVFAGIDAPELGQVFGKEAKAFLAKLLLNKSVKIEFRGKDRVGNHLGIVTVGKDDVRVLLLREGFAWTDERKPDADLEPYRVFAEKKGRGLWKDINPTPPWVFRRKSSMAQPKSS